MSARAAATREIEDLASVLRPLLLRAGRRLRREAEEAGISALDAQLLSAVRSHGGLGVSGLAAREGVSRPTMSVHIRRLEAAGWLEREAVDPRGDRRRAPVRLSSTGAEALDKVRRSRTHWLARRLAELSGEERRALAEAAPALSRLVVEAE